MRTYGTRIIANVAGHSLDDYKSIVSRLEGQPVDMIELNISCPNVKEGGMAFGVRPESVYEITRAVRPLTSHPLVIKLTPNVADVRDNARAAEDGGADAVSLINTLTGMAVDLRTQAHSRQRRRRTQRSVRETRCPAHGASGIQNRQNSDYRDGRDHDGARRT